MLAALTVFVLLLPAAWLAFVCQAMSEELRSVCCCTEEPAAACESGDGCETHLAGFQRGRCEVSLQPVRVIAALPNATAPDPASPQPPVLGIPVSDYLALHASHAVVVAPVDWFGRTIYLTIRRLRIETTPPVVPFPLNQPRQSRGLIG